MNAHAPHLTLEDSTARCASAMHPQRPTPRTGDVLVSKRTARADVYEISVIPADALLTASRYPEALEKVRHLARQLGVDGWYTGDQTHYAQVATHRTPSGR